MKKKRATKRKLIPIATVNQWKDDMCETTLEKVSKSAGLSIPTIQTVLHDRKGTVKTINKLTIYFNTFRFTK